jgi:AraC-like DNA-binding protein
MSALTYLILEIIAITALVLIALRVVVDHPRNRNAWLFAAIFLTNACYVLTRMTFKAEAAYRADLGLLADPVQILMNLGSGLWMIFCYSTFQDRRRVPGLWLFLFALQIVLSLVRIYTVPMSLSELDRNPPGAATRILLLDLPLLLQGAFGVIALGLVLKGWADDLVNSRRLLRWVCVGYLGVLYGGVTLAELALPMVPASQRILLDDGITLSVALSACAMTLILARVNITTLVAPARVVTPARLEAREQGVFNGEADYQKFREVFEDRHAWLQHGLSIAGLAAQMSIPQYRLRQLINSRLGYRNFNALLNAYRIRAACEQLSDPLKKDLPVLTIALSLGYQSISPFNQAFRELVGQTPTQYRTSRIPS